MWPGTSQGDHDLHGAALHLGYGGAHCALRKEGLLSEQLPVQHRGEAEEYAGHRQQLQVRTAEPGINYEHYFQTENTPKVTKNAAQAISDIADSRDR